MAKTKKSYPLTPGKVLIKGEGYELVTFPKFDPKVRQVHLRIDHQMFPIGPVITEDMLEAGRSTLDEYAFWWAKQSAAALERLVKKSVERACKKPKSRSTAKNSASAK